MAGRTEKEAAETFINYLNETLSCVTDDRLTAFQQSKKLYKVFFRELPELSTRSGAKLFISVTQVFGAGPDPKNHGQYKVTTREYSYRLLKRRDIATDEQILSYHWHPHDSELRDPHLHIGKVPRVHFPTSRVCLEDFIRMLIAYYGVRAVLKPSEWTAILEKNRKAFNKMATWK